MIRNSDLAGKVEESHIIHYVTVWLSNVTGWTEASCGENLIRFRHTDKLQCSHPAKNDFSCFSSPLSKITVSTYLKSLETRILKSMSRCRCLY